jgi:hypothetical protein
MSRIVAIALLSVLMLACSQHQSDRKLSRDFLLHGSGSTLPVQLAEYSRPDTAEDARHNFSGRLHFSGNEQDNQFRVRLDTLGFVNLDRPGMDELPPFEFEFVQDGKYLIPARREPIGNDHNWWEYVVGPGEVWDENSDHGFSRAAFPFALKERREDCTHNGLMSFLFNDKGDVSQLAFQISNQTCSYLQFELSGAIPVTYLPGNVSGEENLVRDYAREVASRIPQRPIAELAADYAGAAPENFGSIEEIAPDTMSVFGFLIDGKHYVGGCDTPYGAYPYCDHMALPSYSTAKSLVGGLGLMLAEKEYPGTAGAFIQDLVPECGVTWEGVTIEHALDLTTGHYDSTSPHVDENAAIVSRFFTGEDHATKIDYACNEYPRKSGPGEHWSYQTWATYLAGTAMNARLQEMHGKEADFYRDMLVEKLWKPLGLSPMSYATRRTYDSIAQPFTGFGLTMQRGDYAKLAVFIGAEDGRVGGGEVLNRNMFDAIKQRVGDDPGMLAELESIRYNNGFRTFDVSGHLGCDNATWLTTMSGFGGINIVMMPNDTAYYYFSDGGVHRYMTAVRESHKIRPMCQ